MTEEHSQRNLDRVVEVGVAKQSGEAYPERKRRADHYFDMHLQGQRKWYSARAGKNKKVSNSLAMLVMTGGAVTTAIQLFHPQSWVPIATAVLGAVVVLANGLERIGRYGETWMGYRKASEAMKHEYRLYINDAGDYAAAANDEQAYRWFVERVEQIIGEEESQFWQVRSKSEDGGQAPPQPAGEPPKPADS